MPTPRKCIAFVPSTWTASSSSSTCNGRRPPIRGRRASILRKRFGRRHLRGSCGFDRSRRRRSVGQSGSLCHRRERRRAADDFNLKGQDWGLPPFPPSARCHAYARSSSTPCGRNMRHSGALRIDHVMGIMRLFWVPPEGKAADGVYVRYPFEDMLGLLALESQRNHCLVIGEDLGTVPDEVRHALAEARVLSLSTPLLRTPARRRLKPPQESRPGDRRSLHARPADVGGVMGGPGSRATHGTRPVPERTQFASSSKSSVAHRTARVCCSHWSDRRCCRRAPRRTLRAFRSSPRPSIREFTPISPPRRRS